MPITATARLSSKGQVVIPREVRRRLSLREGDLLDITEADGGMFIRRSLADRPRITLDELYARIPPHEGPPLSLADMERALDDDAGEEMRRGRR